MLTWCVRGERFCDGHWASVIEAGHQARLGHHPFYCGAASPRVFEVSLGHNSSP